MMGNTPSPLERFSELQKVFQSPEPAEQKYCLSFRNLFRNGQKIGCHTQIKRDVRITQGFRNMQQYFFHQCHYF